MASSSSSSSSSSTVVAAAFLLLLSVVAVLVPAASAACTQIGYASEVCQHRSECVNDTCQCSPGWTSYTCGWQDSCGCVDCVFGNMSNPGLDESYMHQCMCESGWSGHACDLCVTPQACQALYNSSVTAVCDKTPIIISRKVFDCDSTDKQLEQLGICNLSFGLQFDATGLSEKAGSGSLQAYVLDRGSGGNADTIEEIFYCYLNGCGVSGGEEEYKYECTTSKCYFTDHTYLPAVAIRLIESLKGRSSLTCNKAQEGTYLMECTFYHEELAAIIPSFPALCEAGECSGTARPIVDQPVNAAGIVFAVIMSVALISCIAISMFCYRRHQQRYFSFQDLDGRNIKFMELDDSGDTFANDVLHFEHITYTLDGKRLLDQVDGIARPSEIMAIIGASGAGKTTLLDIIAQRIKRGSISGEVFLNGQPIGPSFVRITSYVDQDPSAIGTQTVREMLLTSARLRLPEIVTNEQKKERIQSLAVEFGIDHILDRRFGEVGDRGISGGEKRRVQIACQLVTGPSIVFLDEPTSGLDSANALTICRFLKTYAVRKKRTIIMSIHQPRADIFAMFDRLMVLGGGQTLYYGPTNQAKQYFESLDMPCPPEFNPADYILDVTMSDRDRLAVLSRAFRASTFADALRSELQQAHLTPSKGMGIGRHIGPVDEPVAGSGSAAGDRGDGGAVDDEDAAVGNAGGTREGRHPNNVKGDQDDDQDDPEDGGSSLNGEATAPLTGSDQRPRAFTQFRSGATGDDHISIHTVVASTLPSGYEDPYATSFWTQLGVLSGRSFSDMYRYPLLLRMHFLVGILSGVLIGTIFFNLTLDFAGTQNRFGLLLFVLIVLAFGSMSSIGFMTRELEVFLKERASGYYRPTAFFIVKVLFDLLPLRIVPALIMGSLIYFMCGLQWKPALFLHFLLILLLFNCVTALVCMTISTVIRQSNSLANLVAIVTLIFFTLFQGAMINFDALPMWIGWVTFLSPFRFALNSLMVNEFDGLVIYFDPLGVDPSYVTGRTVLSLFGFKPEWAYSIDTYSLLAMMGGWFLIGLLCLVFLVREKR